MVYKYTRPRGPIAAMYSSPGPCYALPGLVGHQCHDPRSSHCRGPAFPFGLRHSGLSGDNSPGPSYFPGSKTYRDGRDGAPHYSMSARHPINRRSRLQAQEPTVPRYRRSSPGNPQLPRTALVQDTGSDLTATPQVCFMFLADRTNGRAYTTVLRPSVAVCPSSLTLWLNGSS